MAIRSKNKLYAALSQRPIHEAAQHAAPEEPMQWCKDMEHHSKTAFQWCEAFSPSIQVLAIIRCNFAPSCSLGSHFWVYLSNERGRNIREILENWVRRSGHGLDLLLVCSLCAGGSRQNCRVEWGWTAWRKGRTVGSIKITAVLGRRLLQLLILKTNEMAIWQKLWFISDLRLQNYCLFAVWAVVSASDFQAVG